MALSLAQLREAFQKNQKSGGDTPARWKMFYPFFKIDFEQRSVFRFLPDNDETNPLAFLVENMTHRLTVNGKQRVVPCLKMYGKKCPCCEMSSRYYNEKNETMGLKYYRKLEYIGQGLVMDSPIEWEDEKGTKVKSSHDILAAGGQPVRLIAIGPKIYKLIQNAFLSEDSELVNAPYELLGGHDFRLRKTKQGEYADYSMSSFSTRPTDVDAEFIDDLTLFNLADYREPEISAEEMESLLNADLTGTAYDKDAASTPAGSAAMAKPAAEKPAPAKASTDAEDPPFEADSKPTASKATPAADDVAEDPAAKRAALLAKIRNRQGANAAAAE